MNLNTIILLSTIITSCAIDIKGAEYKSVHEHYATNNADVVLTDTKITVVLSGKLSVCQIESIFEGTNFFEENWELENRFVFVSKPQKEIEELLANNHLEDLPTQTVYIRINNDISGVAHATWMNWKPTNIPSWNGSISVLKDYCDAATMAHEFGHVFNFHHVEDDDECNLMYEYDGCDIENQIVTDEQIAGTKKYAFGIPE